MFSVDLIPKSPLPAAYSSLLAEQLATSATAAVPPRLGGGVNGPGVEEPEEPV